jgi:excisionase family DNA binding protein
VSHQASRRSIPPVQFKPQLKSIHTLVRPKPAPSLAVKSPLSAFPTTGKPGVLLTQDVLPPYLTRQQAAAILHCTVQGVDRLIQRGTLTAYKLLRRVLISTEQLFQAIRDAEL